MIILIIILIILFGWSIFMIWYASPECMENDYQKYIKRKIKNKTNKK